MAPHTISDFFLTSRQFLPDTGHESKTAPGDESGLDDAAYGDGGDSGIGISTGGLIAIIIAAIAIAVLGGLTAVLFYIAKKREWTLRETLRRSARKVVTALTPRSRTEFPRELKDDVPPTPGIRSQDLQKGLAKAEAKRLQESRNKRTLV